MTTNTQLILEEAKQEIQMNLTRAFVNLESVFSFLYIETPMQTKRDWLIQAYMSLQIVRFISGVYVTVEDPFFHGRISQLIDACLLLSAELGGEVI